MKLAWQSKTNWVALIMALVAFVPGGSEWITAHPQATSLISAAVMIILRFLTKEPITLVKK